MNCSKFWKAGASLGASPRAGDARGSGCHPARNESAERRGATRAAHPRRVGTYLASPRRVGRGVGRAGRRLRPEVHGRSVHRSARCNAAGTVPRAIFATFLEDTQHDGRCGVSSPRCITTWPSRTRELWTRLVASAFGGMTKKARWPPNAAVACGSGKDEIERMTAIIRTTCASTSTPAARTAKARMPRFHVRAILPLLQRERRSGAGFDSLLTLADLRATHGNNLKQETWTAALDVCRICLENSGANPEDTISPPKLLDGNNVIRELSLAPGRRVGEVLEAIREGQTLRNTTREDALEFGRKWLEENERLKNSRPERSEARTDHSRRTGNMCKNCLTFKGRSILSMKTRLINLFYIFCGLFALSRDFYLRGCT